MPEYAAFLRGINVGGRKPVPMPELKKAFESMRFKNVRTLLASGNVVFEARPASTKTLTAVIEKKLRETFEQEIEVLIRTMDELLTLGKNNPFKDVSVTKQTRLYVTFISEQPKGTLKIPCTPPGHTFSILQSSEGEVFTILTISPRSGTTDFMAVLEKEFGRRITTRNWNTILRIIKTIEFL
jgi:uncharacterized protein (DUF1697 family)